MSAELAMKKWGVKKTQLYDLLKNKHLLETKLTESPVRSAKRASVVPQEQTELEDRLCRWMGSKVDFCMPGSLGEKS